MRKGAFIAYATAAAVTTSTIMYKAWDSSMPEEYSKLINDSVKSQPLKDKTIVITGANGSVGAIVSRQTLRQNPRRVIFTCKNASDCMELKKKFTLEGFKTKMDTYEVNFRRLETVIAFSKKIHSQIDEVDAFINCSGWYGGGKSLTSTCDGIEEHLAVNLFGPYLLTELLMDLFMKAKQCRLIYMLCPDDKLIKKISPRLTDAEDLQQSNKLSVRNVFTSLNTYDGLDVLTARLRSQLLMLAYLEKLSRRVEDKRNVLVMGVDPCTLNSNYYRNMDYKRYFLSRVMMKPVETFAHRHRLTGSFTPMYLLLRPDCTDYQPGTLSIFRNLKVCSIWRDLCQNLDDPDLLFDGVQLLCEKWTRPVFEKATAFESSS